MELTYGKLELAWYREDWEWPWIYIGGFWYKWIITVGPIRICWSK